VTVTLWTHKIRGLHRNDFVTAAKINALAAKLAVASGSLLLQPLDLLEMIGAVRPIFSTYSATVRDVVVDLAIRDCTPVSAPLNGQHLERAVE
jgi:hypothetical protein